MNTDNRPAVTRRDIPAIVFCYAAAWIPILLAIVATARPDIIIEWMAK